MKAKLRLNDLKKIIEERKKELRELQMEGESNRNEHSKLRRVHDDMEKKKKSLDQMYNRMGNSGFSEGGM